MGGPVGEEAILDAVERHLAGKGTKVRLRDPGVAGITWQSLLDCSIIRSVESREEIRETRPGTHDLSSRATYTALDQIRLPPPADPSLKQRRTYVRSGSVQRSNCTCTNGRMHCQRCRGEGRLSCGPTEPCPLCRGIDLCSACDGTGNRRYGPHGPSAHDTSGRPAERIECAKCGAPEAACAGCAGRARRPCSDCHGKGFVPCPECDSAGTLAHQACGGQGWTTGWTEGVITHSPSTETVTLPEPGRRAFFLVRHWAAGAGAWRETHLDSSCDILPDELDSAYRTVLHDRLRRRKNEVARHATIRHLPLVRITLHDTPAKVIYAFPTASRVEILALPAPWRTAWAAGVVTVVAAALCLLAAVIR